MPFAKLTLNLRFSMLNRCDSFASFSLVAADVLMPPVVTLDMNMIVNLDTALRVGNKDS
jgi:hypothetical protein